MKGLKKLALVTAIAAAPLAAQAEMEALNDGAMGDVTGQAGVTIDIDNMAINIKEVAYEDKGFLVIDGLRLGGNPDGNTALNTDYLDDIRIHVDVAGENPRDDIPTGTAGEYLYQESMLSSLPETQTFVEEVETDPNVTDGDLVISMRTQSGFPVDFRLEIDSVSLAPETRDGGGSNVDNLGELAASNPDSTVLVSDLTINGNLGPIDIVVQEETESMNINAYFNAEGQLTLPFMGTSLGFALHNDRGLSTVGLGGATSFAHAQVDVSVAENYDFGDGTVDGDALAVNIQDFSGDLDLTNITMGNGASIGSVYMTDMAITAETVIYGHGN